MRYEYIKSEFFSFLSQKMQHVSEAYRQLPYYLRRSLLLIWYFFPSVLPNGNQCQHHPLNCIQVPSRSFSLTLYAVLAEVAVKIPVHAFNSPMLFGYLPKLSRSARQFRLEMYSRCSDVLLPSDFFCPATFLLSHKWRYAVLFVLNNLYWNWNVINHDCKVQ